MNITASPNRFWGRQLPRARQPLKAQLATAAGTDEEVAVLRLYDPIDSWGGDWGVSAKEVAGVLDELPDTTSNIRLHINSPGGEVFEGIAIMNLLREHRASVTAVVDGLAASAASFIASSADETIMGQNSELMIHDAWGLAIGNAADMRDLADRLDHLSNNIASVYAAKAGGSVEDWRTAMLAETWYSADEAVSAGLADKVSPARAAAEQNAFDLSQFKHAGRSEAPAPTASSSEPEPESRPRVDSVRHRHNARRAAAMSTL